MTFQGSERNKADITSLLIPKHYNKRETHTRYLYLPLSDQDPRTPVRRFARPGNSSTPPSSSSSSSVSILALVGQDI